MSKNKDHISRLEKRAAALKENMRRRKDLKKQKKLSNKDDSPDRKNSD